MGERVENSHVRQSTNHKINIYFLLITYAEANFKVIYTKAYNKIGFENIGLTTMPLTLHNSSQSGMTGIHTVTAKTKGFLVQANDRKQKHQKFEKEHKNLENEATVTWKWNVHW